MYHRTDRHEDERDEHGEAFAHDQEYDRHYVREHSAGRGRPRRARDGRVFGLGLLLGAALGAGAALLMAPASGEDTRRQLRRGARRLYARGSEAVEDLREDADRMARRLARRGIKRSRDIARDVRDRIKV